MINVSGSLLPFGCYCSNSGIQYVLGRWVRERGAGSSDGIAGGPAEGEEGLVELGDRQPLSHLRVLPLQTGEIVVALDKIQISSSLMSFYDIR